MSRVPLSIATCTCIRNVTVSGRSSLSINDSDSVIMIGNNIVSTIPIHIFNHPLVKSIDIIWRIVVFGSCQTYWISINGEHSFSICICSQRTIAQFNDNITETISSCIRGVDFFNVSKELHQWSHSNEFLSSPILFVSFDATIDIDSYYVFELVSIDVCTKCFKNCFIARADKLLSWPIIKLCSSELKIMVYPFNKRVSIVDEKITGLCYCSLTDSLPLSKLSEIVLIISPS